jgi:toxin YhaV
MPRSTPMKSEYADDKPLKANGWTLLFHPLFEEQVEQLTQQVETLQTKVGAEYTTYDDAKRLAAIYRLVTEIIPTNPADPKFRQGNTLGSDQRHWYRAKFFQQYRLFFRFGQEAKIIIYVWVNDTRSKRAYNSKNDAYRVFKKMLERGNPPSSWKGLIEAIHDKSD